MTILTAKRLKRRNVPIRGMIQEVTVDVVYTADEAFNIDYHFIQLISEGVSPEQVTEIIKRIEEQTLIPIIFFLRVYCRAIELEAYVGHKNGYFVERDATDGQLEPLVDDYLQSIDINTAITKSFNSLL